MSVGLIVVGLLGIVILIIVIAYIALYGRRANRRLQEEENVRGGSLPAPQSVAGVIGKIVVVIALIWGVISIVNMKETLQNYQNQINGLNQSVYSISRDLDELMAAWTEEKMAVRNCTVVCVGYDETTHIGTLEWRFQAKKVLAEEEIRGTFMGKEISFTKGENGYTATIPVDFTEMQNEEKATLRVTDTGGTMYEDSLYVEKAALLQQWLLPVKFLFYPYAEVEKDGYRIDFNSDIYVSGLDVENANSIRSANYILLANGTEIARSAITLGKSVQMQSDISSMKTIRIAKQTQDRIDALLIIEDKNGYVYAVCAPLYLLQDDEEQGLETEHIIGSAFSFILSPDKTVLAAQENANTVLLTYLRSYRAE